MTSPTSASDRIRFDDFEADLRTEELFRSGRRVRLPHQSFLVLATLMERAGGLVTREELRTKVWPAGTQVEFDQGLNAVIKRLREALGDSAEKPRFIETLPKRGYRFIAVIQAQAALALPPTPDPSSEAGNVESASATPLNDRAAGSPSPNGTRSSRTILAAAAAGLLAILLIAGISWTVSHRSIKPLPPPARQVVPFTSLPGREVAPTFSPDGSQIAFAWNGGEGAGNQFDLYVKSLGSERLLRLTHHPSRWIVPAWSPDGKMIAFARDAEDQPGIFLIPALGGPERRIVSNAVAVGSFQQINWSPDGRWLAYSGYEAKGVPLHLIAMDSLQAQVLAPAPDCLVTAEPVFSPDGKQLALICISSSAVYAIYVVGLPHGPLRELATIMGYPQGLAWAADGRRLIFATDPGDEGELWQLTLDGQRTRLPFGEDSSAPAIARGGRMAYVRGRKTINIWRADLTAARPEEAVLNLIYSTLTQLEPRYSVDGSRIAFQSNRSGSTEIWTTDAEGADPDRLTSFNGPVSGSPGWCSDGRRIVFDSRASGASAIYIEDINERVPRRVDTSRANLSLPSWSADCHWVFAHDGVGGLYRFPSTGGRAEPVTRQPSSYSVVVAERVIFNVMEPDGVVFWTKPVGGGPEKRLENMPKIRYDDSWAATETGLYFTDSASKPVSLNFYDLASRQTRRLMTLKQTPIPSGGRGIAVSPDGHWLLYTQVDNEESEIMLAPDGY